MKHRLADALGPRLYFVIILLFVAVLGSSLVAEGGQATRAAVSPAQQKPKAETDCPTERTLQAQLQIGLDNAQRTLREVQQGNPGGRAEREAEARYNLNLAQNARKQADELLAACVQAQRRPASVAQDLCVAYGQGLYQNVNVCISSSANPDVCIQQALNSYSNQARREPSQCQGTRGDNLQRCIRGGTGLPYFSICLEGYK